MSGECRLAVVIPCYRVRDRVLPVIAAIEGEFIHIYVVDDACPEQSGRHVAGHCRDPRVTVLFHEANQGVGGAVVTGYRRAVADGAEVIVKIDGDGQMDPALIGRFVAPILAGLADYTKGNRFFNVEDVRAMPGGRLFGNAMLSFTTKLSSGYWQVFDPTNGYTAISALALQQLPLAKLSRRYFFESDMLFRLGTIGASVMDIPMAAIYAGEPSSLRISGVLPDFLRGNIVNIFKRIFYSYFLRDFSLASLLLFFGVAMIAFGGVFGAVAWVASYRTGIAASTGTIMLAALPVILGVQFLLSFAAYDISATPSHAIHPRLRSQKDQINPILF